MVNIPGGKRRDAKAGKLGRLAGRKSRISRTPATQKDPKEAREGGLDGGEADADRWVRR